MIFYKMLSVLCYFYLQPYWVSFSLNLSQNDKNELVSDDSGFSFKKPFILSKKSKKSVIFDESNDGTENAFDILQLQI